MPSEIVFVGDFCLAGEACEAYLANNHIDPWHSLRSSISSDALIAANLECPFTDENKGLPLKWANLKAPPDLHWLLDGLDVAILGNNHIADYGPKGARDTLALLARKGILGVGYGEDLADAAKPIFIDLDGKRLGIVSLCCPTTNGENLATHSAPGVAPLGMATVKQAVEGARLNCDALAVYMHWGCEWVHDPAPDQLRLARHAIDCGADAVIGCHSHTIQSHEQYRGRWIFYSLGNYLFNAGYGQAVRENGVIELIPVPLNPPNRESIAVSFRIVPDRGDGRLALNCLQPVRYGNALLPQPITESELSFDLNAANARLKAYVARNEASQLRDRGEPVFRGQLRNGVMAYWYSEESINPPPKLPFRKLIGKFARKRLSFLRRVRDKAGRTWFAGRIGLKWLHDKRHLPLTPEHWELYDIIHRLCWRELGEFPNLINCRDFNDKIQWLKLFDQSEEIVRCTDKVLVRDYVRERVGEQYLVKLYQVHDHFAEIDFDALPKEFVIKANHDSGTVILVRDKSKLDYQAAEKRVEAALKQPYGWLNGEWAYSYVEPKVLVEEFIEPQNQEPPPDYKFYCIDGVFKFCHYIYDRGFDTKEQVIGADGNELAIKIDPRFKLGADFRKPKLWSEMVQVAQELGRGFKCVRVDLFCTGDRIYVGEMTFWPLAGLQKGEGQKKMGKFLDFDRGTYKPLLLPRLAGR